MYTTWFHLVLVYYSFKLRPFHQNDKVRQNNCAYKTYNNFKRASISVATHNTVGMS